MAIFKNLVDQVIEKSDILLLVIDARRVKESINKELENKLKKLNKKFIYVINKCDLLPEDALKQLNLPHSIRISAINHTKTMALLRKVLALSKGQPCTVGVIGYPNTGKSSLINALKGKHSASTSSVGGHTKGIQKIRVNSKILVLDTPGVFSYDESRKTSHYIIGTVDINKIKDPEEVAAGLIEEFKGKIEEFFNIEKNEDPYETIESIARKKQIFKKNKVPDTKRMAREIIRLVQNGKIV